MRCIAAKSNVTTAPRTITMPFESAT